MFLSYMHLTQMQVESILFDNDLIKKINSGLANSGKMLYNNIQ